MVVPIEEAISNIDNGANGTKIRRDKRRLDATMRYPQAELPIRRIRPLAVSCALDKRRLAHLVASETLQIGNVQNGDLIQIDVPLGTSSNRNHRESFYCENVSDR